MNASEVLPTIPVSAAFRLRSIDVVRGLVMVVMALDHTREFFSNATFDPTDLAHTTPAYFFTRWITHFCAPTFVFLAGTSAFLSLANGKRSKAELSHFLWTRGLWLMLLEVAVITPLGWSFSLAWGLTRLQVIWVIGASMVLLGLMMQVLPCRAIGGVGLLIVAGHNLLGGANAAWLGGFLPYWRLLHDLNFQQPLAGHTVGSLYPILPWFGVMALGYGAGEIFQFDPERRRRWLLTAGLAMIALFALLRGANLYGDPRPWTMQPSLQFSFLSVLNCNKYPPSLAYVLMTLGPILCLLAVADGLPGRLKGPLNTFGRVPLFYYLLHLPLIHGAAVVFAMVRYGRVGFLLQDSFLMRGGGNPAPPNYGYELWVVYGVWAGAVMVLYPACRWFAEVRRRSSNPWLSYL